MLYDIVENKKSSEKSGELWPVCALFGVFYCILDYEYYVDHNEHVCKNVDGPISVSCIGIMLISR